MVTLTLAIAVEANQAVALDYTPGANPVQDAAGTAAAPLSRQAASSHIPVPALPVAGMWLLAGLLSLLGARRVRSAGRP